MGYAYSYGNYQMPNYYDYSSMPWLNTGYNANSMPWSMPYTNSIYTAPAATTTTAPALTAEQLAQQAELEKKQQEEQKLVEQACKSGLRLTDDEMATLKGMMQKVADAEKNRSFKMYALTDGMSSAMNLMWAPMITGGAKMFGLNNLGTPLKNNVINPFKNFIHYNDMKNSAFGRSTSKFLNYGVKKTNAAARYANTTWGGEGTKWYQKLAKGMTTGSNSALNGLIKYGGWTMAATTVMNDFGKLKTAYKDGLGTGLKQTVQTGAKAAGSGIGFWGGAKAGAGIGAKIGSFLGPVGTAVGGLLGGVVGGLFGSWGGKKVAKAVVGTDVADKIHQENITKAGEVVEDKETGLKIAQTGEEQKAALEHFVASIQSAPDVLASFDEKENALLQKLMAA